EWKCAVILKGKGSLIGTPANEPLIVVTAGDSGLSKGGTGDLLTGIVASFLAQGISPRQAMANAAYVHGRASELITQRTGVERSTLAAEIAGALPAVFQELEQWKRR